MVVFFMRNAHLFGHVEFVKHGQIWKAYDSFSLKGGIHKLRGKILPFFDPCPPPSVGKFTT